MIPAFLSLSLLDHDLDKTYYSNVTFPAAHPSFSEAYGHLLSTGLFDRFNDIHMNTMT